MDKKCSLQGRPQWVQSSG